ncbi:TonB-dependent receptor [Halioxenophilus aromaticivorans]|uniref:TonB-dependent receptor n=1 Tax=Halioxenophilus aromaticivorans TaxID=1306992 RepID=A0AAV3U358_9ALTE
MTNNKDIKTLFSSGERKLFIKSALAAAIFGALAEPSFAQESSAQDAARALEEVVVTGTRKTIQNAINIKRDATEVVDGLSAGDIGELPALSIGEALESITGAASHRENGGATEISIRGLGPFLSSTVFNGREATNGSGDRSVNFSQFPAELMSKVAIYKTQDAAQIEGGVAGQIQLETLKPLDYGERRAQFDLKGNVNPDQLDVDGAMSGDIGHRATASYVDQFEFTNGAHIGVAVGVQRSEISQPEQEVRSNSPTGTSNRACLADPSNLEEGVGRGFSNVATASDDCEDFAGGGDSVNYDGDNSTGYDTRVGSADLNSRFVVVPNERGYRQNDTSDYRDSFFAAVQFQPNDSVDINFDVQWSERVQEEDRHDIAFVNLRRNTVGTTYDSLNLSNTGATSSLTTETQIEARGETYNRTEEYLGGGLSAAWQVTDTLTLSGDISFSETTRTEQQYLIRTQTDPRFLTNWERGSSDAGSYTIVDADVDDHSLFADRYRARIDNDLDRTNTNDAIRFDLNYDLNGSIVTAIDAGVRFSKLDYYSLSGARTEFEIRNDRDNTYNDVTRTEAESNAQILALNQACQNSFQEGNEFLASERSGDLFTTVDDLGNVLSSGNSWATFDTRCMVQGVVDFFDADLAYPDLERGANTIDVTEETFAAYLQAHYEAELAGIPVRGKFGLRMVQTDVESIGIRSSYQVDASDALNLALIELDSIDRVKGGSDYTEWLPSFSFVADIAENKTIRGSIFRGLSRANPSDMGFSRSFTTISDDDSGITDVNELISSVNASGNPGFKPLTSWNYDISYEWYPNDDSLLAFGVYYKDFIGGFENVVTNETYNVDGVDITVPVILSQTNDDESTLYGFELTATTRFSMLPEPFDGLGLKLSYNWADSDFEFEDSNLGERGYTDENGNYIQTNIGIVSPGNLPGFSKQTGSAQLYYQIGNFDASVIYKYRSDYFQPYTSNGTRLRFVGDVGVWEARASYRVTDNIKVSLEAINILDEPKTQYFYTEDNLGELNVYGPRLFLGISAKI